MENKFVLSYFTQRILIGIIGMLLPVIFISSALLEGGLEYLQVSISNFYYTNRGDFLVGVLCVLSVFLFAYTGPKNEKLDYWLSNLAAICGLGVAFFPTEIKEPISKYNIHIESAFTPQVPVFGELHLLFAAIFFLSISCMCLFLFTRREAGYVKPPTGTKRSQKDKRNLLYLICGWTMLGCVVIIMLYFKWHAFEKLCGKTAVVFWFETIALLAFGLAWITKGEALWPDRPNNSGQVKINIIKTTLACAVVLTLMFIRNRTESQRIDKRLFAGKWACAGLTDSSYYFNADSMYFEAKLCGTPAILKGKWDIRDIDYDKNKKAINFLALKNNNYTQNDTVAIPYYFYRIDSLSDKQIFLTDLMIKNGAATNRLLLLKQ